MGGALGRLAGEVVGVDETPPSAEALQTVALVIVYEQEKQVKGLFGRLLWLFRKIS